MWRLKVLVQFVLAHVPGGEKANHRIQRAVAARQDEQALLRGRIRETDAGLDEIEKILPLEGAVVVEVGTGWDALPTLLLSRRGAEVIHTYDHLPHLRLSMMQAAAAAMAPGTSGGPLPSPAEDTTLDEFLRAARIDYHAPADATDTGLPDASVDLYYSFAVLANCPAPVVAGFVAEARRVLRPGGLFYALIGEGDPYESHSGSKVNMLKYPDWQWKLMAQNDVTYHNRLRERDYLDLLTNQGAEVVHIRSHVRQSDVDLVRRMKVDEKFNGYSAEELAVWRTELICRFSPQTLSES